MQIGTSGSGYTLQYNADSDQFEFDCKKATQATFSGVTFGITEFLHVCATWTGTTSSLYINGVKGQDDSSFSVLSSNPEKIYIGTESDGSNPYFGIIDDVGLM